MNIATSLYILAGILAFSMVGFSVCLWGFVRAAAKPIKSTKSKVHKCKNEAFRCPYCGGTTPLHYLAEMILSRLVESRAEAEYFKKQVEGKRE